jgi:ABC-2 type transport system permease protein
MNPMLRYELRLLACDRTVWIAVIVLLGCFSFAASSGIRYRAEWQASAAAQLQKSQARLVDQIAELRGEKPADPKAGYTAGMVNSISIAVPAAVPPLAHFAVGQSDLYPRSTEVGLSSRIDALFRQYQIQSPLTLSSGRFDLAYVIVAVLPLLAIVLCFDLVAADRVSGRLPLLAVQAGNPRAVVNRRLWLRGAVLLSPLLLLLVIGLVSGAAIMPLLTWIAIAALYAMFWLLLCAWIALRPSRPEAQAAQLVALWLVLVLALPAGINRLVEQISPPPSQQAFQATMRDADIRANRRAEELLQGYLSDHPELTASGEAEYAGYLRNSTIVRHTVETETQPVLSARDAQLERAHGVAQVLQFLSPAAAVQVALSDAAGTGPEQQSAYVASVRAYKESLQERLVPPLYRATKMSADELASLPKFEPPSWVPAHRGALLISTAFMLALLCALLAWRVRLAARILSPIIQ